MINVVTVQTKIVRDYVKNQDRLIFHNCSFDDIDNYDWWLIGNDPLEAVKAGLPILEYSASHWLRVKVGDLPTEDYINEMRRQDNE